MNSDGLDELRFLPVGLDVRGKKCLVVGGGSVGTRKVDTLVRAGAEVTVVSPTVTAGLTEQIEAGRVRWVRESFREEHVVDVLMVVAATDDEGQNERIAGLAGQRGTLVCDASSAERSDAIFGALLQRDGVTVAVFTDGRDPARARRTRDQIAGFLARPDPSSNL